jgi:excisionase family DNA binding protein
MMEPQKTARKKDLPERIALSIDQVAALIGLSRWTVSTMLEEGTLPGFVLRTGRRKKIWRVRKDVLQKWIEAREAATRQEISSRAHKLKAI